MEHDTAAEEADVTSDPYEHDDNTPEEADLNYDLSKQREVVTEINETQKSASNDFSLSDLQALFKSMSKVLVEI